MDIGNIQSLNKYSSQKNINTDNAELDALDREFLSQTKLILETMKPNPLEQSDHGKIAQSLNTLISMKNNIEMRRDMKASQMRGGLHDFANLKGNFITVNSSDDVILNSDGTAQIHFTLHNQEAKKPFIQILNKNTGKVLLEKQLQNPKSHNIFNISKEHLDDKDYTKLTKDDADLVFRVIDKNSDNNKDAATIDIATNKEAVAEINGVKVGRSDDGKYKRYLLILGKNQNKEIDLQEASSLLFNLNNQKKYNAPKIEEEIQSLLMSS